MFRRPQDNAGAVCVVLANRLMHRSDEPEALIARGEEEMSEGLGAKRSAERAVLRWAA